MSKPGSGSGLGFFGRGFGFAGQGSGTGVPLPRPVVSADYSSEPHPHSRSGTSAMRGELWMIPQGGSIGRNKKKAWVLVQDQRLTIYSSYSTQNTLIADLPFQSIHRAFHFHAANATAARGSGADHAKLYFFGIDVVGAKFERLMFATDEAADYNLWANFLSQFRTYDGPMPQARGARGSQEAMSYEHATEAADDAAAAAADHDDTASSSAAAAGAEAAAANERAFFRAEIERVQSTSREWQARAVALRQAVEESLVAGHPASDSTPLRQSAAGDGDDDWVGVSAERPATGRRHRSRG